VIIINPTKAKALKSKKRVKCENVKTKLKNVKKSENRENSKKSRSENGKVKTSFRFTENNTQAHKLNKATPTNF
jgi:hypothetical protein